VPPTIKIFFGATFKACIVSIAREFVARTAPLGALLKPKAVPTRARTTKMRIKAPFISRVSKRAKFWENVKQENLKKFLIHGCNEKFLE
jgi:hypothetical protein